MVIAGGTFQVPLCQKVKEMGYTLINTNLYENSPAFAQADIFYVGDVKDKAFNLDVARRHQVDAVLTDQTDIAVPTVAYVAKELGLPGMTEDQVELFTDKSKMRAHCERIGFPSPEYRLCETVKEAVDFFLHIGAAIIIKPLDAQASRGVHIIHTEQALRDHFQETLGYSRVQAAVLCERFVTGCEFTVDGIFVDGVHQSLAISKKRHFAHNKSIASELFFSSSDRAYDYTVLRRENDRLMNSLSPHFALTHCEYRFHQGKYYLIEMAARGGGTFISSMIVPAISGWDNYDILIRQALGETVCVKKPLPQRTFPFVVLKFLDVQKLRAVQRKAIKSIEGIEQIRELEGILHFDLDLKIGDVPRDASDDRSRIGYYVAASTCEETLRAIEQKVYETLKVGYKN